MKRIDINKMLGILITFLVGYAAAGQPRRDSYPSTYLQDQQFDVQTYMLYHRQKITCNPCQEESGEPQTTNTSPNYRSEVAAKSATPLLSTLATDINDFMSSLLGTSNVKAPKLPQQGYPLVQARPYPSTTPSAHASRPIWSNNKPANSNAFNTPIDAKAVPDVVMTNAANVPAASSPVPTNSPNKFSADLFQVITGAMPQRNIVYSPISLQLLLAFVYIGASGRTALQLQSALLLPESRLDTENLFYNLLQTNSGDVNTQLVMANKMYHSRKLTLQSDIEQSARYFGSEIEAIEFNRRGQAVTTINSWVAQKTQNIIRDLLTPEQVDAQTQAILVSAIHFKAKWAKEFSTTDTEKQKFFVTSQQTTNVSMMYNDGTYRYGEFPELDASGVELPYDNSNISMLLLLPNKVDGLRAVEQRLRDIDLGSVTARMQLETVELRMPRFTVDYELDMRESLGKLGISDLFTDRAELRGFFRSQSVAVSQMQHKAFLDVNEAGSEAAAASFIQLIPLSLPNRIIKFTVDHPFIFAIRSPQAVYFIGHVVNIQS